MFEKNKFIEVGKFYQKLNDLTGSNLPIQKIYMSKGLRTHIKKRKHFSCLKYIKKIPDIILYPDYVGINPNESGQSIELVKAYKKNILLGIKFNVKDNYIYVSTMYEVQPDKLHRRIHSGRLKKYNS